MTDLDKAAREWADENDYIYPEAAPFKAGHARGVADERERAKRLVEATGHLVTAFLAGLRPPWSQVDEAFEALKEYEAGNGV